MYRFKYALFVLIVFSVSNLISCKHEDASSNNDSASDDSGEYARVNDVVITNDEYNQFAKAKRESQPDANLTDQAIIEELIATELLRQEAVNQGIAERPEIIEQIRRQKNTILINTLMTDKFGDLKFTDEELKAEYDRLVLLSGVNEFKARHILLETEADANAVLEALKGGADFIELAKEKSQGPSAPNGGDLGWFKAETMVPPFAEAVRSMEKGTHSTEAVKTRFGWHVILLEDKRDVEPPAFEDVKQDVQRTLTRQTIEGYVEELQNNAAIIRPGGSKESES